MDSTYMPISAKAGLLSAVEVPSSGGETEFADMRAAYGDLDQPDDFRFKTLRGNEGWHMTKKSRSSEYRNPNSAAFARTVPVCRDGRH